MTHTLDRRAALGTMAGFGLSGWLGRLAADDAHELPLRVRELVVEPTQHAPGRHAVVVLHELERAAELRLELLPVEALE